MVELNASAVLAKVNEFKNDPKNKALLEGKSDIKDIISIMIATGVLPKDTQVSVFKCDDGYEIPGLSVESNGEEFSCVPEGSYQEPVFQGTAIQRYVCDEQYVLYTEAMRTYQLIDAQQGWTGNLANNARESMATREYMSPTGIVHVENNPNAPTNTRRDVFKAIEQAKNEYQELEQAGNISEEAFCEKFKELYGVEYNETNISNYENTRMKYSIATDYKQQQDAYAQEHAVLLKDAPLSEESKYIPSGYAGIGTQIITTKEQVYEREFNKLAQEIGEGIPNAEERKAQLKEQYPDEKEFNEKWTELCANILNQYIEKSKMAHTTIEEKFEILKDIVKQSYNEYDNCINQATSNKGMDGIKAEYDNTYALAYGTKTDAMKKVDEFNMAQQKGSSIVKTITSATALTVISVATGGLGVLPMAGVAAGATLVTEVSDELTKNGNIQAFKEGGLAEYVKSVGRNGNWKGIAIATVSSGAMMLAIGGATYPIASLVRLGTTTAGLTGKALDIATGVGTNAAISGGMFGATVLMKGEVTTEDAVFIVVMAVVGSTIQVIQINKAYAAKADAQNAQLMQDIANAKETLGFKEGEEITPEMLKTRWHDLAKANHTDVGGEKVAIQLINGAHDILEANLTLANKMTAQTVLSKISAQAQPQAQAQPTATGTAEGTSQALVLASSANPLPNIPAYVAPKVELYSVIGDRAIAASDVAESAGAPVQMPAQNTPQSIAELAKTPEGVKQLEDAGLIVAKTSSQKATYEAPEITEKEISPKSDVMSGASEPRQTSIALKYKNAVLNPKARTSVKLLQDTYNCDIEILPNGKANIGGQEFNVGDLDKSAVAEVVRSTFENYEPSTASLSVKQQNSPEVAKLRTALQKAYGTGTQAQKVILKQKLSGETDSSLLAGWEHAPENSYRSQVISELLVEKGYQLDEKGQGWDKVTTKSLQTQLDEVETQIKTLRNANPNDTQIATLETKATALHKQLGKTTIRECEEILHSRDSEVIKSESSKVYDPYSSNTQRVFYDENGNVTRREKLGGGESIVPREDFYDASGKLIKTVEYDYNNPQQIKTETTYLKDGSYIVKEYEKGQIDSYSINRDIRSTHYHGGTPIPTDYTRYNSHGYLSCSNKITTLANGSEMEVEVEGFLNGNPHKITISFTDSNSHTYKEVTFDNNVLEVEIYDPDTHSITTDKLGAKVTVEQAVAQANVTPQKATYEAPEVTEKEISPKSDVASGASEPQQTSIALKYKNAVLNPKARTSVKLLQDTYNCDIEILPNGKANIGGQEFNVGDLDKSAVAEVVRSTFENYEPSTASISVKQQNLPEVAKLRTALQKAYGTGRNAQKVILKQKLSGETDSSLLDGWKHAPENSYKRQVISELLVERGYVYDFGNEHFYTAQKYLKVNGIKITSTRNITAKDHSFTEYSWEWDGKPQEPITVSDNAPTDTEVQFAQQVSKKLPKKRLYNNRNELYAEYFPDGRIQGYSDGFLNEVDYPDGSRISYYPRSDKVRSRKFPNGDVESYNTDGTLYKYEYYNGNNKYFYPNGNVKSEHYDAGITCYRKDGVFYYTHYDVKDTSKNGTVIKRRFHQNGVLDYEEILNIVPPTLDGNGKFKGTVQKSVKIYYDENHNVVREEPQYIECEIKPEWKHSRDGSNYYYSYGALRIENMDYKEPGYDPNRWSKDY